MAADALENVRQAIDRFQQAIAYLDACGEMSREKYIKAHQIAGGGVSEENLAMKWSLTVIRAGDRKAAAEQLRIESRKLFAESLAELQKALPTATKTTQPSPIPKKEAADPFAEFVDMTAGYIAGNQEPPAPQEEQKNIAPARKSDAPSKKQLVSTLKTCLSCNMRCEALRHSCPQCGETTFTMDFQFASEILLLQQKAAQFVTYGDELIKQGRYAEAERNLKKAIELNPFNETAYANMGGVFFFQKQYGKAIPWFEKALNINPRIEGVPEALAQARAEMTTPRKAIKETASDTSGKGRKMAAVVVVLALIIGAGILFSLRYSNRFPFQISQPAPPEAETDEGIQLYEPARLFVETTPEYAQVAILNAEKKFFPGVKLAPGQYHIEVSCEGYDTEDVWVTLEEGQEKTLTVALENNQRVGIPGHLYLDPEPDDVTIKFLNVNRKFEQGMEIEPGKYFIDISSEGYETQRVEFTVNEGEEKRLNLRLKEIPLPPPATSQAAIEAIAGKWRHTLKGEILTFHTNGLVTSNLDSSRKRRWKHGVLRVYHYTDQNGKDYSLEIFKDGKTIQMTPGTGYWKKIQG